MKDQKLSKAAMARRMKTSRSALDRFMKDIIRVLNPILRGWGNYFRTGNAARKFGQIDDYVVWRLRCFMIKRKGRNLHAGEAQRWDRAFFERHGLCRLRGTVRYPEAA